MSEAVVDKMGSQPLQVVTSESVVPQQLPLRVLHVHSGNIYGGVEATLLTQVRARRLYGGIDASFALCFAGRFSKELTEAGAQVHWLGEVRIRQPLSVRRARLKLKELIRQQVFDVVVTHSCWSQAIFGAATRAAGLPLAFYMHSPADGRHWLERLARRTVPDVALCNSRFTAETLPLLYPGISREIVHCPVAPPSRRGSNADARLTRDELQTPHDATVIIQVSRMEPWKGQDLHLKALSRLKHLPGWICWQIGGAQTAGEKKYFETLKKLASELGISDRVRFPGHREDVPRLLASADIFCQPNTGPEPFGIVFIEALYSQLPTVTTNMGGPPEIVDDSCGVLVPPGDDRSLAAALERLIREPDLRVKLGNAGPARASSLCDPVTQMKQLREVLTHVVQQERIKG